MKTSLKLWASALTVALFTGVCGAALPRPGVTNAFPVPPVETKPWWSAVEVTPFGAVKHNDFGGGPILGAGVDIGYRFNKTVSLHASLLTDEDNNWRSSAIDETSLLLKGDLFKFYEERAVLYAFGSADRSWDKHKSGDGDWGFGAGAGLEFWVTRNISFGADYRVRAWFERTNDDIARGFLRLRF